MNNQEHDHDHFQYLSEMGGEAVRLTWFAIETKKPIYNFFNFGVKILDLGPYR